MRPHYRIGWNLALAFARVVWGYRRDGVSHIPATGPVIIASNHVSFWDPILVGLGCPREVHFMAKEELFRNRFLSWLIRAYNAVPVRRDASDSGALRTAAEVLKKGEVLLIFPGGTRDQSGEVRRPRPGVGFLASVSGAPVVPARIDGSNRLLKVFLGADRLTLRLGSPLVAKVERTGDGYREFSGTVAEEIARLGRQGQKA